MLIKTAKYSLLAATIASLAACGSGQERGLHWGHEPTPPTAIEINGTVGTFALNKANVDFSSASCTDTTTDVNGKFTFKTSATCKVTEITIPESTATKDHLGNPFTGILKLKSYDFSKASSGLNIFITPLTTLEAYAGNTSLSTLFPRLGLSTGIQTTKVEEFDVNTKASKADLAIILATQYLATDLEDQLQKTNNLPQATAAKIVYEALVKHTNLKTTGAVFDGTNKTVDAATVTAIVNEIFPATTTNKDAIAKQTHLATQKYYNDLLAATDIKTVLEPKDPIYAPPTIGPYTLAELQNSTAANPLTLSLTDLKNGNIALGVGMKNVLADNLKDTIKFTVVIETTTANPADPSAPIVRTATMILDSLNVTLTAPDTAGLSKIDTAQIPVNAKLSVDTASIDGTQTNQTLRNIPVNNGSITLDGILSVSSSVKQQYTNYINSFPAGTKVKTTTTIAPVTYALDSATSTNVAHFVLQ